MNRQFQKSTCVLIYSRISKKVVVIDHKMYGPSLPGGKVEEGETFREAAIREIFEETGLALQPGHLQFEFDHYDEIYQCRCFSYWVMDSMDSVAPYLKSKENTNPRFEPAPAILTSSSHFRGAYIEMIDRLGLPRRIEDDIRVDLPNLL